MIGKVSLPELLPGVEAHLKMAPKYRLKEMLKRQPYPADAKRAAVLVLLIPDENSEKLSLDWSVLLIKRSSYDGTHSGEMALPGGKSEPSDIDFIATACREAYEEMGIERSKIEVIGALTPLFIPPSNFIIEPVVAVDRGIGKFTPDPREVNFYTQVGLNQLDPEKSKLYNITTYSNEVVKAPSYLVGGHIVWGATAMILSELYLAIASSTADGVIGNL